MGKKLTPAALVTAALLLRAVAAGAQTNQLQDSASTTAQKFAASGLGHRSFLYVGEWDTRHPEAQNMTLVKKGKVVWQYSIPLHPSPGANQEFDDINMLPNGNIVFARMSGAGIVTPDKKLVWEFVCPPGTETHSCVPIGKDSVLMVLNGNPAKVLIINTATSQTLKEIPIPVTTKNTHGQFRHVRMTQNGTHSGCPCFLKTGWRNLPLKGKRYGVLTQNPRGRPSGCTTAIP